MVAMTTYVVRAKRWAHGWELHIDGVGVTQSHTLGGAEQMVRDYIETLTDRDVSDATVVIEPDLGGRRLRQPMSASRSSALSERTARPPQHRGPSQASCARQGCRSPTQPRF
jgi:hypothetical protein